MIIPNTIQDTRMAGLIWLQKRLELDEQELFDYNRPLKVITEKSRSPFEKQVARYGFLTAITKNLMP